MTSFGSFELIYNVGTCGGYRRNRKLACLHKQPCLLILACWRMCCPKKNPYREILIKRNTPNIKQPRQETAIFGNF